MSKFIDADALQAAIKELESGGDYTVYHFLEIIDKMPAADVGPVRKWISCSERLPDHGGTYLVCTNKSKVFMAHFYAPDKFSGKATIAHWMDRPEPPKMDGGREL